MTATIRSGPGRIVILNGVSSSGKTTIATAFRDQRAAAGDFWLLMGLDDFLVKLPTEWQDLGYPGGPGRRAADGIGFEATPAGRILRVGAVGRRLLRAYQSSVASAAGAGVNVVVDEVVIDAGAWHDWQVALAGLDVTWVGVHCAADVAARREQGRGDRPVGMTGSQTDTVHRDAVYDFELDTTSAPPDVVLRQLNQRLGY